MVCRLSLVRHLTSSANMYFSYSLNQGLSSNPQASSEAAPLLFAPSQTAKHAYTDGFRSAQVSAECVTKFNELKLNKKIKFIIYKLDDNYKEIVIDEASENGDWEVFREKLINAQSKSKTVCILESTCGEAGKCGTDT